LAERLRARRGEIEQAILPRIHAISDPKEAADPDYAIGLRAAVSAAIDYALASLERGEDQAPKIPVLLLAQARMAARNGVSLDAVLRRYFAGQALLGDFLLEEAERDEALRGPTLKRLLRSLAATLDRLLATIGEEYRREAEGGRDSTDDRRAERVRRLLAGELFDTSDLGYDFEAHHLGAIAMGNGASEATRDIATRLDARLLAVHRGDATVWAWLGARRALDPSELERVASDLLSSKVTLALGEPAEGLDGWRLTHRQARAALPIAMRSPSRPVRYREVALLASVLGDELLAISLRRLYLEPLVERDEDGVLGETLRAYFAAGHNVSSAAAALGVNRHTVTNRIRVIEDLIGRSLDTCSAELDTALRLEELGDPVLPAPIITHA